VQLRFTFACQLKLSSCWQSEIAVKLKNHAKKKQQASSVFLQMSGQIIELDPQLLEERLKFWRVEITRCLDSVTFVSRLASFGAITEGMTVAKLCR